jgi:hypothetical protein
MVMKILGKDLFVNGFALSDDGRVIIGDGIITEYMQGRPIDEAHDTSVGIKGGHAITYLIGQGMTADGKMVYLDTLGSPVPANTTYVGGFPYTSDGTLVVDSIGKIVSYTEGIPLTVNGAVAAMSSTPPPVTGTIIVTEKGDFVVTELGVILIS